MSLTSESVLSGSHFARQHRTEADCWTASDWSSSDLVTWILRRAPQWESSIAAEWMSFDSNNTYDKMLTLSAIYARRGFQLCGCILPNPNESLSQNALAFLRSDYPSHLELRQYLGNFSAHRRFSGAASVTHREDFRVWRCVWCVLRWKRKPKNTCMTLRTTKRQPKTTKRRRQLLLDRQKRHPMLSNVPFVPPKQSIQRVLSGSIPLFR